MQLDPSYPKANNLLKRRQKSSLTLKTPIISDFLSVNPEIKELNDEIKSLNSEINSVQEQLKTELLKGKIAENRNDQLIDENQGLVSENELKEKKITFFKNMYENAKTLNNVQLERLEELRERITDLENNVTNSNKEIRKLIEINQSIRRENMEMSAKIRDYDMRKDLDELKSQENEMKAIETQYKGIEDDKNCNSSADVSEDEMPDLSQVDVPPNSPISPVIPDNHIRPISPIDPIEHRKLDSPKSINLKMDIIKALPKKKVKSQRYVNSLTRSGAKKKPKKLKLKAPAMIPMRF